MGGRTNFRMTQEQQRRTICDQMGFKDPDFLKWQDGMWEAEESLLVRHRKATDPKDPDYGVWVRYVDNIREIAKGQYGGDIHASVPQRQMAFLKATGAWKGL